MLEARRNTKEKGLVIVEVANARNVAGYVPQWSMAGHIQSSRKFCRISDENAPVSGMSATEQATVTRNDQEHHSRVGLCSDQIVYDEEWPEPANQQRTDVLDSSFGLSESPDPQTDTIPRDSHLVANNEGKDSG